MAIAGADGSIILQTKVDTTGLKQGTRNIKSALGGLSGTLKNFMASVGVAFGVAQLIRFGKEAVNLASDIEEVQNVVDVAFGSMAYKMEEFADTSIESFGISKLTAKQTGSSYMAMAKGMQFTEDVASDMALTLTGLSADMASFYNISQSEAKTALSAVYTGETETLKRYGILITEINLQEFARQKGIKKSINAMTQQEKVMLRYQYVLQATELAQGDFLRTQDSWANQARIMQERYKEMKIELGEATKTIATLVLPSLNMLISGMTRVARVTKVAAENIAAFFGKDIKNESAATAENSQSINESISSAGDSTENFADALKDGVKESKKLLASFDEISILSEETSGGQTAALETEIGNMSGSFNPKQYSEEVVGALSFTMEAVGGALVAVGLILIGFGQFGWGVGFIIAGAAIFAVGFFTADGSSVNDDTRQMLSEIMDIAGYSLAAIGVILLTLGYIPWGVGFIIAGAAVLLVKKATEGAFNKENIKQTLSEIMEVAKWAFVVLGVILLFLGHVGWGIGFIIAGAATHAIKECMEGSFEGEAIKSWIKEFGDVVAKELITIGVILLFVGLTGWGIGFILAGASLKGIKEVMEGNFDVGSLKAWLAELGELVGDALMIIGTIMMFAGFVLKGIGFILAGAALAGISAAMQDEDVVAMVAGKLAELAGYIAGALAAVGVVALLMGNIPLGLGLIIGGIALLGVAEYVADAFDINIVKEKLATIAMYVAEALFALGVVLMLVGNIPLGIGLILASATTLVGTIGATWNALPEQTKASLQVLTTIVTASLFVIGVIVMLTGNVPLGLALIGAGALGIIGLTAANDSLDSSALQQQLSSELDAVNATAQQGVNRINNTLSGISMPSGYAASSSTYASRGISHSVPRLAKGAVIPPNREFLAVLGDQKSGTNVEAPLSTIQQAVAEVVGNMGGGGGNQTVILEVDGRELGRTNISQSGREFTRIGTSLLV